MKQRIPKIISTLTFTCSLFTSPALAGEQKADTIKPVQKNAQNLEHASIVIKNLNSILESNKKGKFDRKKVKKLSAILAKIEKQQNISTQEEQTVGWALNRLANLYCPSQTEPDCKAFDEKSFEKGNDYKRREFELHSRLHPDRNNQITYNLALLNWYMDRRREREVEVQRKILSELMGTFNLTDPNKKSYSCGGLLNDENGNPVTNPLVVIGCGMG